MSLTGWGPTYEKPIALPEAKRLAEMHPFKHLPELGCEIVISRRTMLCGELSIEHRLVLANVGHYYLLASPTIERHDWLFVFSEVTLL